MSKPKITVNKLGVHVVYPTALVEDMSEFGAALRAAIDPDAPKPPPPPDPGPPPLHARLLEAAADSPVLTELLTLHAPRWPGYGTRHDCTGDEYSGYDAEPPDWPCETVAVVAHHLGVEIT